MRKLVVLLEKIIKVNSRQEKKASLERHQARKVH